MFVGKLGVSESGAFWYENGNIPIGRSLDGGGDSLAERSLVVRALV